MTKPLQIDFNGPVVQLSADIDSYDFKAKVPILVMGSWKHSVYGDLKYSQAEFDEILANWKRDDLGYEPPLSLGHDISTDVADGLKAEGFLDRLYQEGNVLYGDFGIVDEETYNDIDLGKYRYSSAELAPNRTSKVDGSRIGLTLVGCALTNKPFLTKMPRVEALKLSDSVQTMTLLFSENPKGTPTMTNVIEDATITDDSRYVALSSAVELLTKELNQTKIELSQALATLASRALDEKLAKINALTLDADTKVNFSDMVKAGMPVDLEAKMFDTMQKLSDSNTAKFETPAGTGSSEDTTPKSLESPYAKIIERNVALSENRKAQKV